MSRLIQGLSKPLHFCGLMIGNPTYLSFHAPYILVSIQAVFFVAAL
jgi:hypothetical protein